MMNINSKSESAALKSETSKRIWGLQTYQKWDNFKESDEDESLPTERKDDSDKTSVISTRFDMGDGNFSPEPHVYVDRIDLARLNKLSQSEKETWQLVRRKLRVWSKSNTGMTYRPYCFLMGSLYPTGKLVNQDLCPSFSTIPEPNDIMLFAQKSMLDPIVGEQRRPKRIVLSNKKIAELVCKSLEMLKIECSVASEAEGFDDYVDAISFRLISQQMASSGGNGSEVTPLVRETLSLGQSQQPLLASFYEAALLLFLSSPWDHIEARKAVELRIETPTRVTKDIVIPGGRVWICVHAPCTVSPTENEPNQDAETEPAGLSVFFSRLDLESRLVPIDPVSNAPFPVWRPEPRCHFTGEKENTHIKLKRTKPRTFDLRTGDEICYKNLQAQRDDWIHVKDYSRPLAERDQGLKEGKEFWAEKEYILFFKDQTLIPFLDLEAIESNNWLVWPHNEDQRRNVELYPSATEVHNGSFSPPSPEALVWISRACRILTVIVKQLLSGDEPDCIRFPEGENVFDISEWTSTGVTQQRVKVVASPIILQKEMDVALLRKQTQLEAERKVPMTEDTSLPCNNPIRSESIEANVIAENVNFATPEQQQSPNSLSLLIKPFFYCQVL